MKEVQVEVWRIVWLVGGDGGRRVTGTEIGGGICRKEQKEVEFKIDR